MSRLQLAIEQIMAARVYTTRMLDNTNQEDWFRQPAGGVSHIGWQAGHLAMAEYRLVLDRVRGPRPEDEALIPRQFVAMFSRESVPSADPKTLPSASEIRTVFDRVHVQVLRDLPSVDESTLDQ